MNCNTTNSYIPFDNFPDLLTVDDIQSALGIGRNTAYQLIYNGDIRSIKIGRSIRIPKPYLIDFVYGTCYNAPVASGLAQLKEVQTGSLQIKSERYYVVVRMPDATGKSKQKWINTGISEKAGKRKATGSQKNFKRA